MELNTSYFPLESVQDATCGYCHEFAIALHQLTGLNMGALWLIDKEGTSSLVHAFCMTDAGKAVDVEGIHEFSEFIDMLKEQFSGGEFSVHGYSSVLEYKRSVEKTTSRFIKTFLTPRPEGVALAKEVILASDEFLRLLSGVDVKVKTFTRCI